MDQVLSHRKKKIGDSFIGAVLVSLLFSALLLLLLLFVSSFLALSSTDPGSLIPLCGNAAALISALFCGFLAARLRGRQGLLVGAAAGLSYLLFFLLGLAVLAGDASLEMGMILFSYLIFFSLSVLGGVLGTMKRKPRRRSRKPRH